MDNPEPKNNTTEKNVLGKIHSGDIKMKPRTYFITRTVLLILGTTVLFLFITYLISFIIFSLRASGLLFLPRFGFLGLRMLIGPLPWFLILLTVGLIVLLQLFAKHFSFVYRRPITYSLIGIISLVLVTGLIIGNTPFHAMLFRSAQDRHLPFIGPFYRGFGAPDINNFYHGIVSEVNAGGFVITTPNNEEFTIIISSQTRILNPGNEIKEGDIIVVIGTRQVNTVQAFLVRKVDEDTTIFPKR